MSFVRSTLILSLLIPGTALAGGFAGADAITTGAVKNNIGHLASDALEGRGSGAKGGRMAGDWLAAECKKAGLAPAGVNGTYFQGFTGQGQNMRNVVAAIPGSQPGEAIVIGAHYDHLGKGHQFGSLAFGAGKGKIHNGADDNASGTAAVLEIAKAFKASGQQPRRTVIFMWFDGEERGLLGSKHWVANPTVNAKVVFMLNLDMVGRLSDQLTVYGGPTGDLIPGWMKNANVDGLKLKQVDSMTSNSDHASFYGKGIPVLMPFTGLHGEYHRPGDDTHLVNHDGVVKIARFAYGVAFQAANSPKTAKFKKAKDGTMQAMMEQMRSMFGGKGGEGMGDLGKRLQEMLKGQGGEGFDFGRLREMFGNRGRRRGARRATRPRLGVYLQEDGVTIRQVTEGSVAEKAGLQVDDTIVSFGGVKVSDLDGLRAEVAKAKGTVEIVVKRGGKLETLSASFGAASQPRTTPRRPRPRPTPAPEKDDKKKAKWF